MEKKIELVEKSLVEILDILNHPEDHKDVTFKEFITIASELSAVGRAMKDSVTQPTNFCDVEDRFKKLEARVEALEDRLDSICRAFVGGDYYD